MSHLIPTSSQDILVLHGRGGAPEPLLDRLGLRVDPADGDPADGDPANCDRAFAPLLDREWTGARFASQVQSVRAWLEGKAVAVGHSWGAWLLLAAAEELHGEGLPLPRLLLMAPLVGQGRHPSAAQLAFIPPRAKRLRLAIEADEAGGGLPRSGVIIVHGLDDAQVPVAGIRACEAGGFECTFVADDHALRSDAAVAACRAALAALLVARPG